MITSVTSNKINQKLTFTAPLIVVNGNTISIHFEHMLIRGVGSGLAGPVLAGSLFQGKNIILFLQKLSNKQKC